ncbi:unnamed protein product [Cylindrotheca closterium]|uniref:Phenazine biosynthesis-like domain-containing protein n=1 Tax=Cylindrotheca closterium TaxID=2856 RepID=A0AAD2G470_9STRA|nr:unnamed protein product [Cylindrotheca closterium]
MSRRIAIEKVVARVFGHPFHANGGNPVTIFLPQSPLLPNTQEVLAKECSWESVMVETLTSEKKVNHKMAFFMPSGLEVSFCAHAAMGGAVAAAALQSEDNRASLSFAPNLLPEEVHTVAISPSGSEATLKMKNVEFENSPVSHSPSLQRLLRGHLGISGAMLGKNHPALPPTFCNASVVRPKTMVHVNDIDDLRNKVQVPRVKKTGRNTFESACGAIDESTGIYLYSHVQDDETTSSWECRQFPRASGYPEDPATGIAAAALAASMVQTYSGGGIPPTDFNFYQGMSMDRPSLIQVVDLQLQRKGDSSLVSLGLKGKVEIDERSTIEVEQEEAA